MKNIQRIRKAITGGLTRSIGKSPSAIKEKIPVKRILISRPNHRLGNLLLVTPLLQEISGTFPEAKIDLFVKGGLGPILFENYENVDRVICLPKKPFKDFFQYLQGWVYLRTRRYDLFINIEKGSSSGRLSTKYSRSHFKIYGDPEQETLQKFSDIKHHGKGPVRNLRSQLDKFGYTPNPKPIKPLNLKLKPAEVAKGKELLQDLVGKEKKTIGIFTYATGSKRYSETWWEAFHAQLKLNFPEYNILEILPVENVSQLGFQATCFYSKDVREIGSVIANTEVYIGADCGITHLASSVDVPTVALFCRTDPDKYGPYNQNSLAINTNSQDTEYVINTVRNILDARERTAIPAMEHASMEEQIL